MCGVDQEQKDLEASQAQFYRTLQTQDAQMYSEDQGILSQLQSTYAPILAAGSGQYGFTNTEDTILNTQATEGMARNYAGAKKALQENQAAQGGGNTYLPSGVAAQQNEQLDSSAAAQRSAEQLQIKQAGYQQGAGQFAQATSALASTAQIANPTAFSNSANSAGEAEGTTASQIAAENNSWMAPLGAAVGAVGAAATGAAITKCWIAAELYGGWNDRRVVDLRRWIFGVWAKRSRRNEWVADLYVTHGERVADWIRRYPVLRRVFRPIFDRALREARKGQ